MSKLKVNMFTEINEQCEFYTEASKSGDDKFLYIEGPMIQTNVVNRNRRKYPRSIMEETVDHYITERVNTRTALGELDHPEDRIHVNSKEACMLITDMYWDKDDVIGKARILKTPNGETVKKLHESGVQLTVSTRGGGRSKVVKNIELMQMFVLTAVDLVSYPSAPDAMMQTALENKEFFIENNWLTKNQAMKMKRLENLSTNEFNLLLKNIMTEIEKEM